MNIIGGEMTNACTIFEKYIKELKLSTLNEYVYIIRDNIFGDVMFSPSSNGISRTTSSQRSHIKKNRQIHRRF